MRVHFIGIAGVGMSAAAILLKESGAVVSGSDVEAYGPTSGILSRAGIPVSLGYRPENLPPDVDCFVIGRNAKLSPAENAEVRAAFALQKRVYSFPELLGEMTRARQNVIVVGSYGKSSVTALLAHVLRHAGIDAGYFVGAEPVVSKWLPAPSALGSAEIFVLEGDEYPSAHDDSRAKFLHLHPHDLILTSVVHDHVNVYPTPTDYEKPFVEIASLVPPDGVLVVCADEPNALSLARASGKKVVTYGHKDADFEASAITPDASTRFTISRNGAPLGELETGQLGTHSVENALGAAAYVLSRALVPFEAFRDALRDFPGVRRRLDNITPHSRVPVYEGFGSSYEKARAAIAALTLHFSHKRLVVVFEPHTFGWRNRANLSWYDKVFSGSAEVFIAPPEKQGALTHDQLSYEEILECSGGKRYKNPSSILPSLAENDVLLILTSGDLGGTLPELAEAVSAKFPV